MNWKDLKDAWGLEEIPRELRRVYCCSMCGETSPNTKLYTNRPPKIDRRGARAYDRNWIFCRYHAEAMYAD